MGCYIEKRYQISNTSCITLISRNRRDFLMESIRAIKNDNNVKLSPPNVQPGYILHCIHDSPLWENCHLLIWKILGILGNLGMHEKHLEKFGRQNNFGHVVWVVILKMVPDIQYLLHNVNF